MARDSYDGPHRGRSPAPVQNATWNGSTRAPLALQLVALENVKQWDYAEHDQQQDVQPGLALVSLRRCHWKLYVHYSAAGVYLSNTYFGKLWVVGHNLNAM